MIEDGQIYKAIALAREYVEVHQYQKRLSEGTRNHRNNVSERVRVGGMREILDALIVQADALESISKNSCCDTCREAGLVAKSVLLRHGATGEA